MPPPSPKRNPPSFTIEKVLFSTPVHALIVGLVSAPTPTLLACLVVVVVASRSLMWNSGFQTFLSRGTSGSKIKNLAKLKHTSEKNFYNLFTELSKGFEELLGSRGTQVDKR